MPLSPLSWQTGFGVFRSAPGTTGWPVLNTHGIDSALDPLWGNRATSWVQIQVPRGTTFYEGAAAAQRGLVGGGNQVFLPWVDDAWVVGGGGF